MKKFAVIENGTVVNIIVTGSASDIEWHGYDTVELTDTTVDKGYLYADGVFTAPEKSHADEIADAVQKKNLLRLEAQNKISLWQTELQLGIISDDDKASLIAWMKYIQALNAVDTSAAPDIEWPVKPE